MQLVYRIMYVGVVRVCTLKFVGSVRGNPFENRKEIIFDSGCR